MAIKIIHIFNHEVFVDRHISNVKNGGFENYYVFLKDENIYSGNFKQLVKHVVPHSPAYFKLIKDCKLFDILILYDLEKEKIEIVNRLNEDRPIIIWSFYGAELYSLPHIRKRLFSPATIKVLNFKFDKKINLFLKSLVRSFYHYIRGSTNINTARKRAMLKIDYFAWYSKEEYDFLNEKLRHQLPAFIESSIATPFDKIQGTFEKSDSILIGNSASPYNNHLDIIQELDKLNFSGKITIPFSYGSKDYIFKIKEVVKSLKLYISFVEDFLPYEDYISLINQHSIAVFNSYRQMALGNIFIALKCGVKVYLSLKNPSYQWLKRLGFIIYSIEKDLTQNIKDGDLRLSREDINLNVLACKKISDGTSNKSFLDKLSEIARKPKHTKEYLLRTRL